MLPEAPIFWVTLTWRPFSHNAWQENLHGRSGHTRVHAIFVMKIHVNIYTKRHQTEDHLMGIFRLKLGFEQLHICRIKINWNHGLISDNLAFCTFRMICRSSDFAWSVKCFGQSHIHTNSCLESRTKWGLKSPIKHAVTIPYCKNMLPCSQRQGRGWGAHFSKE